MGQVHAENREPKRVAERMFGEPFGAHAVVEDLVGVAAGLRAHLPIPCRGAVVSAQAVPHAANPSREQPLPPWRFPPSYRVAPVPRPRAVAGRILSNA